MERFDYLVLGGGSAGSVLAGRLSENPALSVALFEAGGAGTGWLTTVPFACAIVVPRKLNNWAYSTTAQPGLGGRQGYQPRGKALGGSSAINAMIYVRGHRADYDEWAALGNPGWGFDDVLPFFRKAENNEDFGGDLHGRGGPLNVARLRTDNPWQGRFLDAAREAQLPVIEDFNGPEQEGCGAYQVTQIKGERCSAARAYLHPFMGKRANLHVETGAQIQRILFEGHRAIGAEIRIKGAVRQVFANHEVILSAGAFGSPQILMLSGVGPAADLLKHGIKPVIDLPAVGQNLQDHVDFSFGYQVRGTEAMGYSLPGFAALFRSISQYRRERRGMITTNFAEAGGFLSTMPGLERPDVQLHFVVGLVDDHARKPHWGHGISCHFCALRPKSRGAVQLASPHADAAPKIDPHYLEHPDDLEVMVRGYRLTEKIMQAPALQSHVTGNAFTAGISSDDDIRAIIRQRADTIYHPVGTCAMGPDPASSVVDASLRVHGLDGLRVVDASIMPRLIGGNTNAPTIMIAEKAADMIKAEARN